MSNINEFKSLAKDFSVLIIETDESLRIAAGRELESYFHIVELAENETAGLEKFKKYHYSIVITDIQTPNMGGMNFIKRIKQIQPETKIVVMSTCDDKEYLANSIELNVSKCLIKPVSLSKLNELLHSVLLDILYEKNMKLYYTYTQNITQQQDSMIIMYKENKPLIANLAFLDFFDSEDIEDFNKKYLDLGAEFMNHPGFLYNDGNLNWFESLTKNDKTIFHAKIKEKHFILRYYQIDDEDKHSILIFDDVTHLNLFKLFKNIITEADNKIIFELLKYIERNNIKLELHNYYKGLSIVNDGYVHELKGDTVITVTSILQKKAIRYESKVLLSCDVFPKPIESYDVKVVSNDEQMVEFKNLKFIKSSPLERSTVRVAPFTKQSVSLFLGEGKFYCDIYIEDISLDAIKLKLASFPTGLTSESNVRLDIVLELDKKPFIINTKAKMLRSDQFDNWFYIVFLLEDNKKDELAKYIGNIQMSIIKEFKGIPNENASNYAI